MAFAGKGSGLETRLGMTQAAIVLIRLGSKFAGVRFRMALGAERLARLIPGPAPLGLMTLRTGQWGMFSQERKSAAGMSLAIKQRRLKTRRVVTGGTIRACRARCKLSPVRIFMAVPAEFMRHLTPEVALLMAFPADRHCVLSNQAKLRDVVIEIPGRTIALPTAGIVTSLALTAELHFLECAVVRIRVTALTAAEGQPFEYKNLLRCAAFPGHTLDSYLGGACCFTSSMAFLARNSLMQAGEAE